MPWIVALTVAAGSTLAPALPRAQTSGLLQVTPGCIGEPVPRAADGWPNAVNDSLGTVSSGSITFPGAALLDNDTGTTALSIVSVGPASSGGGTVTGTGPYTFTFAPGFTGGDVFPYEIRDAAGQTAVALVRVTAAGDTTFPTVSITAPLAGATVSGSVPVRASATDNIGVTSVRFLAGTTPIGDEDTSAPFEVSWDTTAAANGPYSLSAIARDAAGNTTTSALVSVSVSNAPAPPPPAPSGLVLALSFDEATGTTAIDVSGLGNAGTIAGATRTTAGRFGGALSFDGVNDWVTVADAASLDLTTGMTLEAWVKPTALTGWRTVMLKETASGLAYAAYANDDVPTPAGYVRVGTVDRAVRTGSAISTTNWTHLATTYDGTALRLYVNGTLANTTAVSGPIATSARALRIGGNAIWGEYFAGLIDEVRVYNRALTAGEITTDMNAAIGGAPAPAMVTVPDLSGMTRTQAESAITGAQLSVGTVTEANHASVPAGQVSGQNPAAQQSVTAGTSVAFTISLGPVAPPPPPGGLVLALSFDEASGATANDASGAGNHAERRQ